MLVVHEHGYPGRTRTRPSCPSVKVALCVSCPESELIEALCVCVCVYISIMPRECDDRGSVYVCVSTMPRECDDGGPLCVCVCVYISIMPRECDDRGSVYVCVSTMPRECDDGGPLCVCVCVCTSIMPRECDDLDSVCVCVYISIIPRSTCNCDGVLTRGRTGAGRLAAWGLRLQEHHVCVLGSARSPLLGMRPRSSSSVKRGEPSIHGLVSINEPTWRRPDPL